MPKYLKILGIINIVCWSIWLIVFTIFIITMIGGAIENSDEFATNYYSYGEIGMTNTITIILIFLVAKYGVFFNVILRKFELGKIDHGSFSNILIGILIFTSLLFALVASMSSYTTRFLCCLLVLSMVYYFLLYKVVKKMLPQ